MISILALDGVHPRDLLAIKLRMTHEDSEWQQEVTAVLEGQASNITPVALCHRDDGLVGWACSHVWRGMQTLEQWVDDRHRRCGVATALSAALVAHGTLDRRGTIAVFSEHTEGIARRLGFADVHRYMHDGADWVHA